MANILPETEVRGSLRYIYPEPKARGISSSKLPMTEVEGSVISHIHRLTMVQIIYTIDTTYLVFVFAYIKHLNIQQDRQKCYRNY